MKKLILILLLLPAICFAQDKIMVQVKFSVPVLIHGQASEFSDALYFTPEQWADMKPEELKAREQERIDNWQYQISHPPVAVEPTKEQLEAESIALDEQIINAQVRKQEIADKLTVKEIIAE